MPTTPSWSESLVVGNSTEPRTVLLARNATTRGAIDLRSKMGAYFFCKIGRTGTTNLTNGVDVLIRRLLNSTGTGDLGLSQPGIQIPMLSQIAAAANTTVNADSAAGSQTLNVTSTVGFAVGEIILINHGGAREEFARVSRLTSATALLLDNALRFTHTAAQADIVTGKADAFQPVWMMGGAVVEVIFDYGDDTGGDSVRVSCRAQVYDQDVSA